MKKLLTEWRKYLEEAVDPPGASTPTDDEKGRDWRDKLGPLQRCLYSQGSSEGSLEDSCEADSRLRVCCRENCNRKFPEEAKRFNRDGPGPQTGNLAGCYENCFKSEDRLNDVATDAGFRCAEAAFLYVEKKYPDYVLTANRVTGGLFTWPKKDLGTGKTDHGWRLICGSPCHEIDRSINPKKEEDLPVKCNDSPKLKSLCR